jgi:hypothetical protein
MHHTVHKIHDVEMLHLLKDKKLSTDHFAGFVLDRNFLYCISSTSLFLLDQVDRTVASFAEFANVIKINQFDTVKGAVQPQPVVDCIFKQNLYTAWAVSLCVDFSFCLFFGKLHLHYYRQQQLDCTNRMQRTRFR